MDEHQETPSALELIGRIGALATALMTLTIQLFPFAMPLILLTVAPLIVLALAGAVVTLPFVLAAWLGRRLWRALPRGQRKEAERAPVVQRSGGQLAQAPIRRAPG
jgi:hypothetical protein